MLIAVIRHASTEWNAQGRMQGRRDIPLSAAGLADARRWRLPADLHEATWVASPLSRAVATACVLAGRAPRVEPALVEMDWGAWEGARLDELRARYGNAFVENEARGLDFRPPRGESPRDVVARVVSWLTCIEAHESPIVAVTHNGVLRALVAAATGWDMTGKPPVRLHPATLHRFSLVQSGVLALVEANVPLIPALSASHPAPRAPALSKALPGAMRVRAGRWRCARTAGASHGARDRGGPKRAG